MLDLAPDPATLDPIETASNDELRSLQLERPREEPPVGTFAVPREQVPVTTGG